MKTAICNVADTGPLESLVIMLRSIGYHCVLPNNDLLREIRDTGCDTVLSVEHLVRGWGYDYPMPLDYVGIEAMKSTDLFIDLKAHRNLPKLLQRWPNLFGKILWYRINGGQPEHVVRADGEDCGDEINPPCPILTPNLWYREVGAWSDRSYSVYPPFYRFDEYFPAYGRNPVAAPVCLIHNLTGWGYGPLIENVQKLGVRCFGTGSPDGLIQHRLVPQLLSTALCMVHLKSSDAPGYALYEALAAGCPVVCTRRLIWRNKMQDLLIPGETCLVFDRETHDSLSFEDIRSCTAEVTQALQLLQDRSENQRIGLNGRNRLAAIMWNETRDKHSLADFMLTHFKS